MSTFDRDTPLLPAEAVMVTAFGLDRPEPLVFVPGEGK